MTAPERIVEQIQRSIPNEDFSAMENGSSPQRQLLEIGTAAEWDAEVDAMGAVGFLFNPVFPSDAYGVLAAADKEGKTYAALDAAISTASGTPWLSLYEAEVTGPVVMFIGEGGKRNVVRRGRAIAAHKGLVWKELQIHPCERVPELGSVFHLDELQRHLDEIRPVLVIIDPLYLAAGGADSKDLANMGKHLKQVQYLAQEVGAALLIIHHWNKTGSGDGSDRMSGVGPSAWGRVLISMKVVGSTTDRDTQAETATVAFKFKGSEIAPTEQRFIRKISVDDPKNLMSPMHYSIEPTEAAVARRDRLSPSARRIQKVLVESTTALTVGEIGDALANDGEGFPLRTRTIQTALNKLHEAGLAEKETIQGAFAPLWSSVDVVELPEEDEDAF